jgi:hypothetical protein
MLWLSAFSPDKADLMGSSHPALLATQKATTDARTKKPTFQGRCLRRIAL